MGINTLILTYITRLFQRLKQFEKRLTILTLNSHPYKTKTNTVFNNKNTNRQEDVEYLKTLPKFSDQPHI